MTKVISVPFSSATARDSHECALKGVADEVCFVSNLTELRSEFAKEAKPDVVVLDIGWLSNYVPDFFETFEDEPEFSETPVVLISKLGYGNPYPNHLNVVVQMGADDNLRTGGRLREAVEDVLTMKAEGMETTADSYSSYQLIKAVLG